MRASILKDLYRNELCLLIKMSGKTLGLSNCGYPQEWLWICKSSSVPNLTWCSLCIQIGEKIEPPYRKLGLEARVKIFHDIIPTIILIWFLDLYIRPQKSAFICLEQVFIILSTSCSSCDPILDLLNKSYVFSSRTQQPSRALLLTVWVFSIVFATMNNL